MADTNASSPDAAAERSETGTTPADSPKPHGDALGTAAGGATVETASDSATTGDSPKRHGDKLQGAVDAAAKG